MKILTAAEALRKLTLAAEQIDRIHAPRDLFVALSEARETLRRMPQVPSCDAIVMEAACMAWMRAQGLKPRAPADLFAAGWNARLDHLPVLPRPPHGPNFDQVVEAAARRVVELLEEKRRDR